MKDAKQTTMSNIPLSVETLDLLDFRMSPRDDLNELTSSFEHFHIFTFGKTDLRQRIEGILRQSRFN